MAGTGGFRWLGTWLLVSGAPPPCSAWEAQPGRHGLACKPPSPALGLPGAVGSLGVDFCSLRDESVFREDLQPEGAPSAGALRALRSSCRPSLRCLNDIFKVNTEVFILLKSRAYLNTKTTYIKSLILWPR